MSALENAKTYTGKNLETIFFRPMLSGPSAIDLGVRVLYNMPVPTTVQMWEPKTDILQKFTAAGWSGGAGSKKLQKTIPLNRVKAELGYSAADYFSLVYELITNRPEVNMEDLTGTELEEAETTLFKQAIAESIRSTMWVGDTSAESGANTFDGFLKTIATYSNNNKVYTYNYETDAMNTPANSVTMFDDLWKNADERLKDLKAEGQLAFFVSSDVYSAYEKHLDSMSTDGAHRLYQRPSKPAVSRHSRRGSAHLVLPGQTEFFVARTQVVLHPDRPPQPGAGRQYGRLPRQRNPHVVQPRRNGEPPASRLHGRLRRARRRTGRIRIAHLTMSGTTPYARPLKPAGGIEAVWLIPASDIVSATYGDGCCTGLTLRAGASADQWPILEQSSSFREENLNPDGPPRFRHTLTLVADPEEIRDRLGERQLARLATEGAVARIETASGVFLLAGRSEKFGAEQPLRLTEIRYESQTKFAARPVLVLTLAGEDTAPAPPIREQ